MKTLNLRTVSQLTSAFALLANLNLTAATLYVSLDSPNPSPPYATWATAAHVIQDAVAAASAGDEIVVTNGVYRTGTVETNGLNRVALTRAVTLRSVNGPDATVIEGAQAPAGRHRRRCHPLRLLRGWRHNLRLHLDRRIYSALGG